MARSCCSIPAGRELKADQGRRRRRSGARFHRSGRRQISAQAVRRNLWRRQRLFLSSDGQRRAVRRFHLSAQRSRRLDQSVHTLWPQSARRQSRAEGLTSHGSPLEMLPVNISLPADEASRNASLRFRLRTARARLAGRRRVPPARTVRPGQSRLRSISPRPRPSSLEQEPNNTASQAQKIAVPCESSASSIPSATWTGSSSRPKRARRTGSR